MKRSIGSLLLTTMAVGAFAQANFTIVRPVDNSRVREKVKILFPKGSIPAGGYVGIFLNGQLIDAVVPPAQGKYQQYILDTKGRGLEDTPDGKPARLEAKLYVDYNGQPRIVRTSSIDLNIANTASIKVPNSGFQLRYNFKPGTELVYQMTQRVAIDTISESQNRLGGKPAELPLDVEQVRMKYAVDNAYPNGDGLLRMQAMPEKGKTYAILSVSGSDEPKKYTDSEMSAVYMRLTSTGKEVFGSIPSFWQIDGVSATGVRTNLFAAFPLPSLPTKSVRPGDSWSTKFQNGKIDLEKLYGQTNVTSAVGPARGEFVGVEWEMGHPCAKIKNSIAEGQMSDQDKKMMKQGAQIAGDKLKVDETVWFAMDTRQVVKIVRDTTLETKTESGGGGMGGGTMGGPPGGPSGSRPPAGAFGPSRGKEGGGRADLATPVAPLDLRQGMRAPGGRGGGPAQFGPGGPGGGQLGGNGRMGAPGAGNGVADATFIRIRIQRVFVLEN